MREVERERGKEKNSMNDNSGEEEKRRDVRRRNKFEKRSGERKVGNRTEEERGKKKKKRTREQYPYQDRCRLPPVMYDSTPSPTLIAEGEDSQIQ